MNTEHFKAWIAALRSDRYGQCTGQLRDSDGYCCLGVLADISPVPWSDEPSTDDVWVPGVDCEDPGAGTPGPGVMSWLDLSAERGDLTPDWPEGLMTQGDERGHITGYPLYLLTATHMNDECRFTFAQIADVFEYFGVAE